MTTFTLINCTYSEIYAPVQSLLVVFLTTALIDERSGNTSLA